METRSAPYAGVVEAVYRILTEETGNIPRRRRRSTVEKEREKSEKSSGGNPGGKDKKEDLGTLGMGNGLRQLYRGLGMGLGANVLVFVLGLVAGGGEVSSGWAEV